MKCKNCGGNHNVSYHLKDKLTDKGFPTHDKNYKTAHEEATKAEKKRFPRSDYNALKRMDQTTPRGRLIGKNLAGGKIEVSKAVPPRLRKEVAYHEKEENKALKRLDARKSKKTRRQMNDGLSLKKDESPHTKSNPQSHGLAKVYQKKAKFKVESKGYTPFPTTFELVEVIDKNEKVQFGWWDGTAWLFGRKRIVGEPIGWKKTNEEMS